LKIDFKKICVFKIAFIETKHDKYLFGRLYLTRFCRVVMVCSLATAKFRPTLHRNKPQTELEIELIQTQTTQELILRAELHARALGASKNLKRAEVWVGARCA
jgi:hypothetical protein